MGTKMTTTNPLVSLPDAIFSNILEYLDWGDVGRLDTAFLNLETRNSYLFALQLMKVKVERNIWNCCNITDEGIRALASGCPQLQSLNIAGCYNITDEEIRALARGCPKLQSLNIGAVVGLLTKE